MLPTSTPAHDPRHAGDGRAPQWVHDLRMSREGTTGPVRHTAKHLLLVATGLWRAHEAPMRTSIADLADFMESSPAITRRALALLEREGLVHVQDRDGDTFTLTVTPPAAGDPLMGAQPVRWAMFVAPVTDVEEWGILAILAADADKDGRSACVPVRAIAEHLRLSERTVQRRLRGLEARGLIARGDQAQANPALPKAHRPTVYDLAATEANGSSIPAKRSGGAS